MRYIIIILILVSCGPTHDLNKAKRLIERAKAHGAIVRNDTVYSESIVYTKGDCTVVKIPVHQIRDTTIFQDRIKILYKIRRDTVRMTVECPPDTIRIKVPVSVTETIECPPTRFYKSEWFWLTLCLAALLVLALVRRR